MEMVCCPSCKYNLAEMNSIISGDDDRMRCPGCKREIITTEGYIDFLGKDGLKHSSKREKVIRDIYAKIYTPATNFMFLFCGGVNNARREVLSRLDIQDNDFILETGMGAGENFLWISNIARNISFYGIDIQKQMMEHCRRNLKRWNIKAEIMRADAEELPFLNEKFDVVFHLGAINLFRDKKKAIDEMIRVSKPGKKIIIADESEKAGKLFNYITGSKEKIIPPVNLIPSSMSDIKIESIWKGYGYVISFFKPEA